MKIRINRCVPGERQTFSQFADAHGLEVEVHERASHPDPRGRWFAHFAWVDTVDDYPVCIGEYGDGATPAEAIAAYASRIAGHRIKHWNWKREQIVTCPASWEPEDFSALVPA